MSTKKAAVAAAALLASTALAQAEIRLGASLSVTGPASFLGDPALKTLEMLVEEINANGGIDGERVVLIHYDDAGDANRARTFATRLVEDDEVHAVIGGSTTGTTMAMSQVFNEAEIPFVSLAGAVVIIDPVQPFVFKTPHTDRMACEKIFADIESRGLTRVGMISGSDGFGASMREQCLDVVQGTGIEIVGDETYGPTDADMTPQLTRLRNTPGIEAIVNPGFGQGPTVVTRNFAQLGIDLPFYQSHGVASRSYIELSGPASEGVRLPGTALLVADILPQDDPQHDVVHAYRDAFEGRFNQPVSTFGGYAHDAFRLMVDAIRRAESLDGVAIRDALRETDGFVGTTGIYTMSETDHMGLDLSAFRMLEIRDGDWVLVD